MWTTPKILMLISVILLLLAAVGVPAPRVNLGFLGLAFFVLAFLLG